MKEYDLIVIGTGSGMNYVSSIKEKFAYFKIAVIDKDEPGGICLTRGCIPSKLLLYPAELLRTIETAGKFGIDVQIRNIDFKSIMKRMNTLISRDISIIQEELPHNPDFDYYKDIAEFVSPYTMKIGNETIIGRNPRFIPDKEPEISMLAKRVMSEKMNILTSLEVLEVARDTNGKKVIS